MGLVEAQDSLHGSLRAAPGPQCGGSSGPFQDPEAVSRALTGSRLDKGFEPRRQLAARGVLSS